MNILNIIVIVFILGMAYWWSTQGIFSSLIHLAAVLISGAIAFALWEVVALSAIMGNGLSLHYAWTIGLIVPFLLTLLLLRILSDRYLGSNVTFPHMINMAGGGVLGACSAVLTAGMMILSMSFLPVGPSIFGYQPMLVETNGQISGNAGNGLFFPVDRITAGIYSSLSAGSFSSDQPLHSHQPELAKQAALYRMSYDPNSSPVADPAFISITGMAIAPTPLKNVDDSLVPLLGPNAQTAGYNLVGVDTSWKLQPGMFDGDATLRVSPTQIRLAVTDDKGNSKLLPPLGASKGSTNRTFTAFNDNRSFVWGDGQEVNLGFFFVLSPNEKPSFLMIRHTRFSLPVMENEEPENMRAMAGVARSSDSNGTTTPDTPRVVSTDATSAAADNLDLTLDDRLPKVVSKNVIQGYNANGTGIISFTGVARGVNTSLTPAVMLDHIDTPSHRRTIRIKLNRERANGVFGAARVSAAQVNGIWLTDNTGDKWFPIAYVLFKGNGDQYIHVDLGVPMQSAKDLPLSQMQNDDTFYLYFSVSKGIDIVSYNVGRDSTALSVRVP